VDSYQRSIKAIRMNYRRSIYLIVLANLVGALGGWGELHSRGASVDPGNFGYTALALLLVTLLGQAILALNCGLFSVPHNRRLASRRP
jgi:hypothetical protein